MSLSERPRKRPPPPLDAAALERLALRYVERFATTRGKLTQYLTRKVRERGWDGPAAEAGAIAARMAELGYIDDRDYAEAKAAALGRRGYGARRVADALYAARVDADDAAPALEAARAEAFEAAAAFARRKRIGPFAAVESDPDRRRRELAAMARAGHGIELARAFVHARPGEMPLND